MEANAISKQDYINAVAAEKTAEADVATGKATVQTAQINLGYASVTAPISGRIGRALVTEGALVGQGDVTQLATIQQINPMYVNFTQSTTDVLRLRKAVASGQFKQAGGDGAGSGVRAAPIACQSRSLVWRSACSKIPEVSARAVRRTSRPSPCHGRRRAFTSALPSRPRVRRRARVSSKSLGGSRSQWTGSPVLG